MTGKGACEYAQIWCVFTDALRELQNQRVTGARAEDLTVQKAVALFECFWIYEDFYKRWGLRTSILGQALKKKTDFILAAGSRSEIEEIMKLSCPDKDYSGIVARSPYHIGEEELLVWFTVASGVKLIPEANERVEHLFCKFFPEEARRIGLRRCAG